MSHPQYTHTSSIRADGSRPKIRIGDVVGRFATRKKWVFSFLLIVFFVLPWIRMGSERFVLLWIEKREFSLFGFTFNAQDIYLIFFLVTGVGFLLFFITAMVGRIWCGWTCPQTVFLEGVFRKIERWIEGSKSEQLKLEKNPLDLRKFVKFFSKHLIFIILSLLISTTFVLYFIPSSYYFEMFDEGLFSHATVLFAVIFISVLLYFDFAWFREQVCLILCPYGRLQSALTDDDSMIIGYDRIRGEPRGKSAAEKMGDCIDCGRCVSVCPTGIDIRAGLQMECVGCANCIDACDEIMLKVQRPVGLIRYDSLNGLEGKPKQILRPRIYLYVVLMVIGASVALFTVRQRTSFEANVLRLVGQPFILDQESVRNQFEIHLVNKESKQAKFKITVSPIKDVQIILPVSMIDIEGRADRHIPWMAVIPLPDYRGEFELKVKIENLDNHQILEKKVEFLGPK
jgi:cytochrome c oxidase accessory protein FixG